jgi:hypothetical protein
VLRLLGVASGVIPGIIPRQQQISQLIRIVSIIGV